MADQRKQAERAREMYERHVGKFLPPEERTDWFLLSQFTREQWMKRAKNADKDRTHE